MLRMYIGDDIGGENVGYKGAPKAVAPTIFAAATEKAADDELNSRLVKVQLAFKHVTLEFAL